MKTCDVLVIGGGPAGSTAAYLLSSAGFETVLIERSTFPRDKLCGGVLTAKSIDQVRRLFNEPAETLASRSFVEYCTDRYEIYSGDCLLTADTSEHPFYLVNRPGYDAFLLDRARHAGAVVVEAEQAVQVDPVAGEVMARSGNRYRARVVVGSDGVNSVVRRCLPASRRNERDWRRNTALALQLYVARSDCDPPLRGLEALRIYLDAAVEGYSWVFPNKHRVVIGSGGLIGSNTNLQRSFMAYLAMLGVSTADARIGGHLIPSGGFLREPAYGRALLIGDSAGLADPVTGEGIYYAHRSAELAFQAIRDSFLSGSDFERTYPLLVNRYLSPEIAWAKGLRGPAYRFIGPLKLDPLKPLAKRLEKLLLEIINGRRSYRFLRRLHDAEGDAAILPDRP